MTSDLPRYIKVKRAALILDLKSQEVRDLIHSGQLMAIRLGKNAFRVSEESIIEFLKRRRVRPVSDEKTLED